MEISLNALRLGRSGIVTCVGTDPLLKERLRDFGMVPGTLVGCRCRSPGGSVTALEFRGTVLALRTRDTEKILVCV